jgi:putative flippase GtrA
VRETATSHVRGELQVAEAREGWTVDAVLRHSLFRYLAIGVLSFAVDFGLLVTSYEVVGTPLWFATSAGFWGSFLFNFFANKTLAFRAPRRTHVQLLRYSILVAANYAANLLIVGGAAALGVGYQTGKVVAVACLTVCNYVLYRTWVFAR